MSDGQGYPPQPGYPPQQQPKKGSGGKTALIVAGIVVVLALIGGGVFASGILDDDVDSTSGIALASASTPGTNAFAATPFGTAGSQAQSVAEPDAAIEADGAPQVASVDASKDGLYAATKGVPDCNPAQVGEALEADPAKATAWAGALAADPQATTPDDVRPAVDTLASYLASTTPVLLSSDVRVTESTLEEGAAVARQAVLQKGTPVLVDAYGAPRVSCTSGNPLTSPVPTEGTPTYTGGKWADFDPALLVVVQRAIDPIDPFVLVDSETGESFARPAGSIGDVDGGAAASSSGPTKVVQHDGGSFEITVVDAGWEVTTDALTSSSNSPVIRVAPNVQEYREAGGVGYSIGDITDAGMTPEQFVADSAVGWEGCEFGPATTFEVGELQGTIVEQGPCPETEYAALDAMTYIAAATLPDGSIVSLLAQVPTGDTTTKDEALASMVSFTAR